MSNGRERTLKDFNRLPLELHRSSVKEILPEYFITEYPNIILFLEYYYDFMDDRDEFGGLIKDIYTCRDIEDNSLQQLDLLLNEFALGVGIKKFPVKPREIIRNFAKFYRVKGSKYSSEGFFRAFFLTDAEIHYPKNDLFYLNDSSSEIGVEQQKVLQDGGIYQLLSHLIKTDRGMPEWEELYKKFVHPAGFHLAAEIVIQDPALNALVSAQPVPFADTFPFSVIGSANISNNFLYDSLGTRPVEDTLQLVDITALVSETIHATNYNYRLHVRPLGEDIYLNRTLTQLVAAYPTIYAWGAQTRQSWNITTDSATLIRADSNPSLHLGNGIDSYSYYGTYPSFYAGTGDNPSYMKTPYPSIITTSLAYAELGASHFAADSDMTQAYPLYDSDLRP
mgnify:CR=1 FL=1|tara:strand:+ start:615 stop:1796 length:1182 start_codon:yes stop_codon:yes gene_type:complete